VRCNYCSTSRSNSWRCLHQQQYQSPTGSSPTDLRHHGYHSHPHVLGRPYHPQQTGDLQSDLSGWSRGDEFMSRRSSPFLWLRQCIPELGVSSSHGNCSGKDFTWPYSMADLPVECRRWVEIKGTHWHDRVRAFLLRTMSLRIKSDVV